MFDFNFSENSLELVPPPYFVYDFSSKMFVMLHSIDWPSFIIWSPIRLEVCVLCVLQLFAN